ncbi:Holliday junction resolvase RuvX [Patescibacteria group bacterium]|nr:Holliday junction resolvase RuvX [Patescibacteria group bacterium]MBU1966720.1 Holliday junction resolvase RuvX [Patescibacteria group bacterium]MBU2543705.1 Holliday junction resolvase RuvX [Patescibacteria group bacterium]
MKKILAIDYGTKRIGLAISQANLAEPLAILSNNEIIFGKLMQIIQEEKIELILVGMSENQMADKTKKFALELKEQTAIPIQFIDETLSSKRVHQKLASSHMKLKKRQQPIDHYAAAEMLQEWLEINQ